MTTQTSRPAIPEERSAMACPHPEADTFHEYLEDFQEDIARIIGKFRRPNHHLSPAEIASEVNLSLIKKRDQILSNYEGEFTQSGFRKLAYSYVRNCIKWKQCEISNSDYVGKRTNMEHHTEEGFKTTFDLVLDTKGHGEDLYEEFDRNSKCSFLLRMVREYSSILTDKEAKVLSYLEKGATQHEIAHALGVSHQAISLLSISVADKIKAHLRKDALVDNSYTQVSKGHKSIVDFFTPSPQSSPMKKEDKPHLRKFLFDNARAYTSKQAAQAFMNGKYSNRQIASFASKNKLSFCLLRQREVYKFSADENEKILSLFRKGKSCKSVSSIMGISVYSIRGKKSSLVKQGRLPNKNNEAVGES